MGKRSATSISDLVVQQSEASLALDRAVIKHIVDNKVESVDLILRTLRAHGYETSSAVFEDQVDANAKPLSKQKASQAARFQVLRSTSHAATKIEAEQDGNKEWIPSKYRCMKDFSLTMLI